MSLCGKPDSAQNKPQRGEVVAIGDGHVNDKGEKVALTVKEGDKVKRGAAIAEMGMNGGEALLHFEIRRKGKPVNPLAYLP